MPSGYVRSLAAGGSLEYRATARRHVTGGGVGFGPMVATAAEAPSSKSIVDRDSGTILWSTTTRDTRPLFKLGQLPDSKRRMRFELYTCLGSDKTGVLRQVPAPDANRRVREEELVARHAYFTKMADGYYYWDYQKIRREYGILEFGLDPK